MFLKTLGNFMFSALRSVLGLALMLVVGLSTYTWLTTDGGAKERTAAVWEQGESVWEQRDQVWGQIWKQVPKSSTDVEGIWTAALNRLQNLIDALESGQLPRASQLPQISPPGDPEESQPIDPSSPEATALQTVNQFRSVAGVPAVAQNQRLHESSLGHSRYLAVENTTTHYQTNDENPHYVAAIPSNRIAMTSYWGPPERFMIPEEVKNGTVEVRQDRPVPPSGEVIAFIERSNPITAVEELMAAPYHRMGLLSPDFCDFGYGLTAHETTGYSHVINLSCTRWPEQTGQVILYPSPDQSDLPRSWGGREMPDPYRMHGGAPRQPGYPVTMTVHGAQQLELVEASMQTASGETIALWLNHPGNDNELIDTIILLPRKALPAETEVVAKVTLLVAGETVQREWSFRMR